MGVGHDDRKSDLEQALPVVDIITDLGDLS
jgi:hypothetical protein